MREVLGRVGIGGLWLVGRGGGERELCWLVLIM